MEEGGIVKNIEIKLISELLKNSKKSDRELAKSIGVSQPTITRARIRLEKEGYTREYTVIPDFTKLGYDLMAITFVKVRATLTPEKVEEIGMFTHERMKETPFDLLMLERGAGLGYDAVAISVHENYSSYMEFRSVLRQYSFLEGNVERFLISMKDKTHYLPLTLKVLSKHLASRKGKEGKK
jgi:DNA-binding Lrp family transcriptional regulator